jgi:hypothetical protein
MIIIIIIILSFKSNLWLLFKINDIFFKFLNYDVNNINYNKNKNIYNTNNINHHKNQSISNTNNNIFNINKNNKLTQV